MFKPVKTPCVGVCSTGIGDQVCRGCKRFAHEIVNWNSYSNEQRYRIAQRLEYFVEQVVSSKLEIYDTEKLLAGVKHQQINFKEEQNPWCWLFDLLKAGAGQITDLEVYGVCYRPDWRGVPLTEVKQAIDRDYYALSCAHYERYFLAPSNYSSDSE